jgi:hypothetical protein
MARAKDIVTAIIAQLKSSATLSYIPDTQILEGIRFNVVKFPTICVETTGRRVAEHTYAFNKIKLGVKIFCLVNITDKDHQITGTDTIKGIADMEDDIIKAIDANETFGISDVYYCHPDTIVEDITLYPLRGFSITLDLLYRQDRNNP